MRILIPTIQLIDTNVIGVGLKCQRRNSADTSHIDLSIILYIVGQFLLSQVISLE